jgi:TolB-like protein/Tfp pilus assembly protein PilF
MAMQHKGEAPENPSDINPQIPDVLSRIILKCLEKDKQYRYQSAEELSSELESFSEKYLKVRADATRKKGAATKRIALPDKVRKSLFIALGIVVLISAAAIIFQVMQNSLGTSAPGSRITIAILPFTDFSPQQDQPWRCEGIATDLETALTGVQDLLVRSTNSSFHFKDRKNEIKEIGRALNVSILLDGSIQREGDRLSITAKLINVADEVTIWAEEWETDEEGYLDISSDIKMAVVENLELTLLDTEKTELAKKYTEDIDAYNSYMKGIRNFRNYTSEGLQVAGEYFQQALQADPEYALPYFGLAMVYATGTFWGKIPPDEGAPRSKEYVKKALERDDTLAEAYALLGFLYTIYDWDFGAAGIEFEKALRHNPESSVVQYYYSFFNTITQQHDQAVDAARRAQEIDPVSGFISTYLGDALIWAGEFDRAIEVLEQTTEMYPDFHMAYHFLGIAYTAKSMFKEAELSFSKGVELSNGAPWIMMALGSLKYQLEKNSEGDEIFEELKRRRELEYVPPLAFFYLHHFRNEEELAVEWLDRACEERDYFLGWVLTIPIESYSIPDEPKFNAVLEKYGLRNQ